MILSDYTKLPYTRFVQRINDSTGHYYFGKIMELDGCQSTGDTLGELYESLNEALEGYLSVKLEYGLPIPVPDNTRGNSEIVVQMPKRLYQCLTAQAEKEGVSINELALYKLSL